MTAELVGKSGNEMFILRNILGSSGRVVSKQIVASSADEEERLGEEVSCSFLTHLFYKLIDNNFKIRYLTGEG